MEKEGYRENLVRIREMFPGEEMLRKSQAAAFIGCDPHTVTRLIRFNAATGRISVQDLARQISV